MKLKKASDILLIVNIILILVLFVYAWNHVEELSKDPCQVCVEKHNIECYNFNENIHFNNSTFNSINDKQFA